MKNTSFIFYASFYEATQCLSQNRRGKFLCKLLAYMTGEDAPVFSDKEKIEASLFLLMQPQIKANLARRENGKAGAEHGSKGGRPKKDAEKETPNEERTMPESEIPEYSMPSIDWSEVENADADEFETGGETVNEIEAECAVNRTHDTTDSTDNGGIYNEQKMSRYEGEQALRHIERNIRFYKKKAAIDEAAGLDNAKARAKIGEWQTKARDFSK